MPEGRPYADVRFFQDGQTDVLNLHGFTVVRVHTDAMTQRGVVYTTAVLRGILSEVAPPSANGGPVRG